MDSGVPRRTDRDGKPRLLHPRGVDITGTVHLSTPPTTPITSDVNCSTTSAATTSSHPQCFTHHPFRLLERRLPTSPTAAANSASPCEVAERGVDGAVVGGGDLGGHVR